MSLTSIDVREPAAAAAAGSAPAAVPLPTAVRFPWTAVAAAAGYLALAAYTVGVPDVKEWPGTPAVGLLEALAGGVLLVLVAVSRVVRRLGVRLARTGPWAVAVPVWWWLWETLTAKTALLPLPWFAPPASVVQVFRDDWHTLLVSTAYSLRLLLLGAVIGGTTGLLLGVAIAWWRALGYWVHPVLKLIGPVPASAWLPIVFVIFPTSFSASIFLVSLSAWFPVVLLTWSGVSSVNPAYYDVARTLGAGPWWLVRKVAVPAALPSVFVGLFMGLVSTFATLIVAEMLGVRAGLGWYIQWAIGWAAYNKMFAALAVLAALCSGLLSLVAALRDRFLGWQKELLRW